MASHDLSGRRGTNRYLPVSSTGHLILTSWLMGINDVPFVKDYTVIVHFGAILALVMFWRRFLLNFKIYPVVFIAFLPAAVIGFALKNHIDEILAVCGFWVHTFRGRDFFSADRSLAAPSQSACSEN